MYQLNADGRLVELLPKPSAAANRQDLPPTYALNGAVYVAERSFLSVYEAFLTPTTRAYTMQAERSVDLDTGADWQYAEWTIAKREEGIG